MIIQGFHGIFVPWHIEICHKKIENCSKPAISKEFNVNIVLISKHTNNALKNNLF